MAEERRANPNPFDVTGIVAILYTVGFLALAGALYFFPIPDTNKDALLYLFGILSGIQLTIMAYLYGANKSTEATQRAIEQRQGRAEAVVQDIAKSVPIAAAAAAASTPTPANPTPVEIVGGPGHDKPMPVQETLK